MIRQTTLPTLLLLVILLLGGCRAAMSGDPAVIEHWQLEIVAGHSDVRHTLTLPGDVAQLVRGASGITPATLADALRAAGATAAECILDDRFTQLLIDCRYQTPLLAADSEAATAALPDDTLLALLFQLPLNQAVAVRIETTGRAAVPGVLAGLPADEQLDAPDGTRRVRQFRAAALDQLALNATHTIPPGADPALQTLAVVPLSYLPAYKPPAGAWLAWLFALGLALLLIGRALRVRLLRPLDLRPWQPDLRGHSALGRLLLRLLAWIVNTWQRLWPVLINGLAALLLTLVGVQLLLAAWALAQVQRAGGDLRLLAADWQSRAGVLGGLLPFEWLVWPGQPLLLAGVGLLLLALAAAMLLNQTAARLIVIGLAWGIFLLLATLWPVVLLAPPFVVLQGELAFVLGALLLGLTALLIYGLQHPRLRLLYEVAEHV